METIQRQPMVEIGRVSISEYNSIACHCAVRDWNDNGERPANIPPDEGHYITNNELVGIIMLLWLICAPILSCAISYITKRWIIKNGAKETSDEQ